MLDNMADTELGVAVGHPSDQHVQHGTFSEKFSQTCHFVASL